MRIFLIFLLLAANMPFAFALKLQGYVKDQNGNPVHDASVMVKGTSNGTITDSLGFFNFLINDQQENIVLVVRCMGFEVTEYHYKEITGSKPKSVTIYMQPKANIMNTVVITGTRTDRTLKDSPVLTKVVSETELKETGAVTVLDALESLMPGVYFDPNSMGDNIQVQGLNNKYVLILLNGERLANERVEGVNFARLNVADIKQIEIINGASSVLYGSNAIGAVINIITKDVKQKAEAYAQGRYANFNTLTLDAGLGLKYKNLTSKTTFNRKSTDGYRFVSDSENKIHAYSNMDKSMQDSVRNIGMYPNTDYTVSQGFNYRIHQKLLAELNGSFYSHEILNVPGIEKRTHRLDRNYTVGGKIIFDAHPKNQITLSGNSDIYKNYTVYERINDSTALENDSYYTSLRLIDLWRISGKLQLVSGIEYNTESTYSYSQFGAEPDDKNANDWNLFAQAEWKFIKNMEASFGARLTDHSEFGIHFSPKLSLMYSLNDFRFRGTISNGFKAPSLKEMYMHFDHQGQFDIIGNPNLVPEQAWYESLSAEYIIGKVNISATLYNNNIKEKINLVKYTLILPSGNERDQMHYENVADVQIYGIDCFLQWQFLDFFYFRGAYTFANALDKTHNSQLPGNSKHNVTSSLTYKYAKIKYPLSLTFSGRFSSPRIYKNVFLDPYEEIINERTEDSKSFATFKLVYLQKIPLYKKLAAELQLGVDNIFNHIDTEVNINPGRTFFASLKLSI